jgi:regulator of sigma E protease
MLLTIIATIIFILVLVIGHEFGHFIVAKLMGATVTEFGFGFPPKIVSKRFKGTEYSLNALPFGGFVSIYGESDPNAPKPETEPGTTLRSFQDLPAWKRALIVVAGIVMNLLIAWVVFSIVFMVGIPSTVVITAVQPNSPAAAAGLMPGDQILNFTTPDGFNSFIDNNLGHPVSFEVVRAGKTVDVTASPRSNPPAGQGHIGVVIGDGGVARENVFSALVDGAKVVWEVTILIAVTFWSLIVGLFTAHWAVLSGVTGPVGIFSVIGQATQQGIPYLLYLLGLISINLAVINIVPFPALDGGRILMIGIEKVIRRKINPKVEAWINGVGITLLLFLMVLITIRDISKLL